MTAESEFRKPTVHEQVLLNRLLEADFPGREEIRPLLSRVVVKTIDEGGGLELKSEVEGEAPVTMRIPVEAEGKDEDGVVIHVLLHVVDGRPAGLEIFREDGETVRRMPSPAALELVVLPPISNEGRSRRP